MEAWRSTFVFPSYCYLNKRLGVYVASLFYGNCNIVTLSPYLSLQLIRRWHKRVAERQSVILSFRRAFADSTDIYETACTNRQSQSDLGRCLFTRKKNPRRREWIRSLCLSVCHRGISKTSLCQFISAILAVISRFKEYSNGDWNEWTTSSSLLRFVVSFGGMLLIIARETMTREFKKIVRHENAATVEHDRTRKDCCIFLPAVPLSK